MSKIDTPKIKDETLTLIAGVFKTAAAIDPAITDRKIKAVIGYLKTGTDTPEVVQIIAPDRKLDEVLSRPDAAKMLNVTPRTVTTLAKKGIIKKIGFGVAGRAVGYTLSSIQAAIAKAAEGESEVAA